MKKIAVVVIWMMMQPVVASAGDNDAALIILNGIGAWADSTQEQARRERERGEAEAEEEEAEGWPNEPDSFTVSAPSDKFGTCSGTNTFDIERDGQRYHCYESVTCRVKCEAR